MDQKTYIDPYAFMKKEMETMDFSENNPNIKRIKDAQRRYAAQQAAKQQQQQQQQRRIRLNNSRPSNSQQNNLNVSNVKNFLAKQLRYIAKNTKFFMSAAGKTLLKSWNGALDAINNNKVECGTALLGAVGIFGAYKLIKAFLQWRRQRSGRRRFFSESCYVLDEITKTVSDFKYCNEQEIQLGIKYINDLMQNSYFERVED